MMSARPPKAPTGRPPPMIFPNVVRSGRTPNRSCAPPHAIRNEMTSSKIRTIPWRSVSARRRGRNPSAGGITADPEERVHEDGGEVRGLRLDDLLARLGVVPREDHGVLEDGGRHAGRRGHRFRPL